MHQPGREGAELKVGSIGPSITFTGEVSCFTCHLSHIMVYALGLLQYPQQDQHYGSHAGATRVSQDDPLDLYDSIFSPEPPRIMKPDRYPMLQCSPPRSAAVKAPSRKNPTNI